MSDADVSWNIEINHDKEHTIYTNKIFFTCRLQVFIQNVTHALQLVLASRLGTLNILQVEVLESYCLTEVWALTGYLEE